MDSTLNEANNKIQTALAHLQKELASIRTGRASPALLEDIPVMAYGSKMKMMEVGTISAPQPSLLTIQVWDTSIVKDVEKAIFEANLGLNPSVDGQVVRVPIPPLTQERREEFIKVAHQKGEECRISIRQIRGEERDRWIKAKDSGEIGEDELRRREKLLQEIVDKLVLESERLVKAKEEELKQI